MSDFLYFLDLGSITGSNPNFSSAISIKPFDLASEKWQSTIASGGPTTVTETAASASWSMCHQMIVLSTGHIVLCWADWDAPNLKQIFKLSEWNGSSWGAAITVYENALPFSNISPVYFSIGKDKTDTVHIIFYDRIVASPVTFGLKYFNYKNGAVSSIISAPSPFDSFTGSQLNMGGYSGGGKGVYDSSLDSLLFPIIIQNSNGRAVFLLSILLASTSPNLVVEQASPYQIHLSNNNIAAPFILLNGTNYTVVYCKYDSSISPSRYYIESYSRPASGGTWVYTNISTTTISNALTNVPTYPTSLVKSNLGICGIVPFPINGLNNALTQVAVGWIANGNDPILTDPDSSKFDASLSYPDYLLQDFYGPWVRNGVHYIAVKQTPNTSTNGEGNLIVILKTTDGVNFSACDYSNSPVYSNAPGVTIDALVQVDRYIPNSALTLTFNIQFGRDTNQGGSGQGVQVGTDQCGNPIFSGCTSLDGPSPQFSGDFGSASVFCYDLGQKYWYRFANNPGNFFVEENGTLLGGYSDGFLRQLDTGTDYDGITPISIGLITPFFDGGTPNQRKDTYTLKFFVDTGGNPLTVEVAYEGISVNGFEDGSGTNIVNLGTIQSNGISEVLLTDLKFSAMDLRRRFQIRICGSTDVFRLAYWILEYDERPIPLSYKRTDPSSYGEAGRKRITEIPLEIDTYGQNVTITPRLDGVLYPVSQTINTPEKGVASYYFTSEVYAREIGLDISSTCTLFEFYNLITPQFVDKIPDLIKYLYIPEDNFGDAARKRLRTLPLVINTFGNPINFTPILDRINFPVQVIQTTRKQTVLYYFGAAGIDDVIFVDLAAILDGSGTNFFEFYGFGKPDLLENLPLSAKHYFSADSNLGAPTRKRVRTIPFIINTLGNQVAVSPVVDGVVGTAQSFTTTRKQTVYYFFSTDSFGIDYALSIDGGGNPFEFYGIEQPVNVEVLPPPKVYDQLGPYQFDRVASLYRLRIRILTTTATLNWNLINNDTSILNGSIQTNSMTDSVYEIRFPKFIQSNVMRLELSAAAPFHRWSVELLGSESGMETDNKWIQIQ